MLADLLTKTGIRPSRGTIKRAAMAVALALGVAAAADFGYGYLTTGRYLETTDDAYVQADSTIVSPKVSGYIAEVLVNDNQPVKAGQVLARIDERDSARRWTRPVPMSRRRKPRCSSRRPDRPAASGHGTGIGRYRRRRSQSAVRPAGTGPLRRADEDRFRHPPARAAV